MTKTLVLLAGMLALPALAGASEPTGQDAAAAAPQGTALKVAIDPVTGKLRRMTDAESAALDQAQTGSRSRSAVTVGALPFPTTEAEARATQRTVNGITGMKPLASTIGSVNASLGPNGEPLIDEDGHGIPGATRQEADK